MTFQFPHIPESDAELPDWLSRKMVGPDLAKLVSELAVLNRSNGQSAPALGDVVGDLLPDVLNNGLSVLDSQRLRLLIRHPGLLMELQEHVLIGGGDYWHSACRDNMDSSGAFDRGESGLQRFLDDETELLRVERVLPIYQRSWFVGVMTAAVVLLVVLLFQQVRKTNQAIAVNRPTVPMPIVPEPAPATPEVVAVTYGDVPSGAWGWSIPEAIPVDISGEEYFLVLADLAEEWFDERPDDAQRVAQRIIEFRQGCSILLLSEHKPLMVADRKWLLRSCRDWAVELENHLTELEDREKDFRLVRSEMDETVNRFVARLRKWAPIAKRREQRQTG